MFKLSRLLIAIIFCFLGYFVSIKMELPGYGVAIGIIVGLLLAILAISLEWILGKSSMQNILSASIGLTGGLLISVLFSFILSKLPALKEYIFYIYVISALFIGYIGMMIGIRFHIALPLFNKGLTLTSSEKILDTNVIIDGRILDLCKTNFIDGKLILPRFIINELQYIADSEDQSRRIRGRRGLDVLKKLQEFENVDVVIDETNFPDVKSTDSKLLKLAKIRNAKVITNDFNLNKVAAIDGVKVLNINDLATALKPLIIEGDELTLRLIKLGKTPEQAIGYLEDGTMVIVENARGSLGRNVVVIVTKFHQSISGRIIFGKLKYSEAEKNIEKNEKYEKDSFKDSTSQRFKKVRRNN
jgi:uncharacterized protein YacL